MSTTPKERREVAAAVLDAAPDPITHRRALRDFYEAAFEEAGAPLEPGVVLEIAEPPTPEERAHQDRVFEQLRRQRAAERN